MGGEYGSDECEACFGSGSRPAVVSDPVVASDLTAPAAGAIVPAHVPLPHVALYMLVLANALDLG